MTKAIRKRVVDAIRSGRVEFAVPQAAKCMPVRGGAKRKVTPEGFEYVMAAPIKRGILFSWGYPGVGFGEVAVSCTGRVGDVKWVADTEYMGPQFCAAMLTRWIREVLVGGHE